MIAKVARHVSIHTFDTSLEQKVLFSRGSICKHIQDCTIMKDLVMGRQIYSIMFVQGLDSDSFIMDHIIRMFSACGSLIDASESFRQVSNPSIFTWNALVSAYINLGDHETALHLFYKMQETGEVVPDKVSYLSAIKCCSFVGCIKNSRLLHTQIIRAGLLLDVAVGSSIVDMYCKCGDLPNARKVFNFYHNMDLILWAAQLSGYAQHGMYKEAHQAVDKMFCEGLHLNDVCFLGLITACGHEGDVEEGCVLFLSMTRLYEIRPRLEHYTCIIDMLSRAGRLEEGVCIMEEMSYMPTTEIWFALLGSCRIHGNLKLAERVSECIWMLDPENTSASRLLATTYKRFAGAHLF